MWYFFFPDGTFWYKMTYIAIALKTSSNRMYSDRSPLRRVCEIGIVHCSGYHPGYIQGSVWEVRLIHFHCEQPPINKEKVVFTTKINEHCQYEDSHLAPAFRSLFFPASRTSTRYTCSFIPLFYSRPYLHECHINCLSSSDLPVLAVECFPQKKSRAMSPQWELYSRKPKQSKDEDQADEQESNLDGYKIRSQISRSRWTIASWLNWFSARAFTARQSLTCSKSTIEPCIPSTKFRTLVLTGIFPSQIRSW